MTDLVDPKIVGARRLFPAWLCVGLLVCGPLPWTVQTLSYAHPKEFAILLLGALCAAAWAMDISRQQSWLRIRGFLPLCAPPLVWLAWGGVCAGGHAEPVAALITGAGVLLAACCLTPLAADGIWRPRLDAALVIGALLVALLALGQYAHLLDGLFPVFAHYDQRVYSVFGNQDLLGGYMAVALVIIWAGGEADSQAKRKHWPGRSTAAAAMVQLPLVAALLLSGCRSAWVAAAVGVCVLLWARRGDWRRSVVLLLPILAISAAGLIFAWESTGARVMRVLSGTDIGGSVRLWIWDASLRMLADRPLGGVGPGLFAWRSPEYMGRALAATGDGVYAYNEAWAVHAHSEPVALLAEGGLAGLGIAVWLAVQLWRRARVDRAWPALLTMSVFALVNDAWHSAPHALVTLWLLACATASTRPAKAGPPSVTHMARPCLAGVAILLLALAILHASYVLLPSVLLTRAENQAMSGSEACVTHYRDAARYSFTRGRAMLGLAAYEVGRKEWAAARDSAEALLKDDDTWTAHWLAGLSAVELGDTLAAKHHLRACLFRAPKNKAAFDWLWQVSSEEERASLRAHARVWMPDRQEAG